MFSGKPAATQQVLTNELQSHSQGVVTFDKFIPTFFASANRVLRCNWSYPIALFPHAYSSAAAIFSAKRLVFGRSTVSQLPLYQF